MILISIIARTAGTSPAPIGRRPSGVVQTAEISLRTCGMTRPRRAATAAGARAGHATAGHRAAWAAAPPRGTGAAAVPTARSARVATGTSQIVLMRRAPGTRPSGARGARRRAPATPCRAERAGSMRMRPAHLVRGAVALDVVAAQAAGDEVLPRVGPAARTRDDVVDRRGRRRAVGAALAVAAQHAATRDRHVAAARDAHVATQQDDRRALPLPGRAEHRVAFVVGQQRGLALDHEHQRPLERHDGKGLIARIEYQGAQLRSPLEGACTACRHSIPGSRGSSGGADRKRRRRERQRLR